MTRSRAETAFTGETLVNPLGDQAVRRTRPEPRDDDRDGEVPERRAGEHRDGPAVGRQHECGDDRRDDQRHVEEHVVDREDPTEEDVADDSLQGGVDADLDPLRREAEAEGRDRDRPVR